MIKDVFCKIIDQRSLKEGIVMESQRWIAIRDIHPQAPIHVLIMPKAHLSDLRATAEKDKELLGELLLAAIEVAEKVKVKKSGFRLIVNTGPDAGQLVPHLHLHLIGGKKLGPKIVQ